MRGRSGRLSALTPARVLRGATALTLTFAVSATGLVALATPSRAATAPNILASPTSPGKDPSPTWTFDTTTAPAYECAFDLATVTSPAYTPCPSDGVYTAPAQATDGSQDGDYTFSVREPSADASATTTRPYTLDTIGRVSVVVAPVTNDTTPTWTISPESGATTLSGCTFDAVPLACPTGGTFTPSSPLGDGDHVLRVGITDALGNTGSGSATTTVDTAVPLAPTVVGSSGLHNTGSVTWTWSAAGSSSSCDYTTPAGTTTVSGCTSPFTRSLGQDGDYSLSVTLTDAAGNTGPAGVSPVYTYDTVLPAAPSAITGPTASPLVHTSTNRRPSWTFSTPTATTRCQLTGPAVVAGGFCSNGTYAAPVDLVDGDWTLVVTAISDAGNTASASSSVYTVDTVGPVMPTVSTPDPLTVPRNTAAPQFSWNGEMPVTAFCRTVRTDADPLVAVQRSAYVACDGRVYTAVINGDASYQVEAYLVDPAGNAGAVGISAPWQYDGTPPATPVLGGVPAKGHDKDVTFSFTSEQGATALCWYTPSGGPDSAKTPCDGGSYPVSFPSDGTYTVHAQQTDQATNSSLVGSVTYDLDSTLPSAPTVTPPTSPGSARVVTWRLQANDASTLTCRLLSGTSVVIGTTGCATQFLADLTASGDGAYDLEITATNDHGSTRVLTSRYVLDTVTPELTIITGPSSPGNSADPEWTFPVQPGTTAQCRLVQGLVTLPWTACDGGSFKPGPLADGTYSVDVIVTDFAGNTKGISSSSSYVSDRTKPNAPTVGSPTSPGRDPLASWTWSGEAGATATCRLDRDGVIGAPQACGTTSGTFAPALSGDATYVVVVQLTDPAGNVSDATTTVGYELDTTAPAAPIVTGTSGTGNTRTATWSFAIEANGRAECALSDGSQAPLVFAPCSSGATVVLPGDGSYRYVVHTFDQVGNQSPDGTGPLYVLDSTRPSTPSVAGPQVSPSQNTRPSFTFTAETSATECHVLRSGALVKDWFPCTSPVAVDLSAEVDGSYVVEVRATDAAGNVSDPGASLEYVLDRLKPDAFSITGPAGPSSNRTPSFSWPSTEANLTYQCQLFNGSSPETAVSCGTPYQPTLTVDGSWTLHVATSDLAGNVTTSVSGSYLFDSTPPAVPVVHSPPSPGRDVQPSWTVDVEAGTTQQCLLQTGAGGTLRDWTPCTVPVTTDLTGQPDGVYSLSVQSTDASGLASPIGTASYTLDSHGPDAPLLTLKTGTPGTTRTVPFAFTTEPGATVVCVLTRGGAVLSTQTGCTSPSSVSLAGLAEGPYVLSATATDRAGNVSVSGTATYVLDVTPPAVPLLSAAPVLIGSGRSPSWSFTTEAKAVVTCRLVGTTFSVADSDCSGGTYAPDLAGAPDDTYTFFAYATDEAGNQQRIPLTGTYTLKASAPAGPSAQALSQRTNQPTVTWIVSTPGDRVVCGVTRTVGTVVTTVQPFTDCGAAYTVTLPADGLYTFLAHTVDAAGNVSANITATYRLDTVPPASAVLTAPVSPSSGRSPSWTVASPETSPTATCTVSGPVGAVLPAAAPCAISAAGTPFPLDLTGQPDGPYTLNVRLVDRAGNANAADATSTYVLDTHAPNVVIVTAPATPSNAKTPKWALVGDADATLQCRLSSGTVAGAFAPCAGDLLVPGQGSFTADLTSKPDGTYTLTVRSKDAAGNIGPETTSGYTLDTLKPVLPAPPVTDPSPSQQPIATWTFTVEAGATAYCTLSSATKVVTAEQVCTSPWVTDLTNLPDGDYALALRAQDAAGNTSASVSSHYVLDRTAPKGPLITGSPGSPNPDLTPTWHVKPDDAKDLMECQLAGTPSPTWAACSDAVSFDLAPATSGTYQLLVRETDKAGNRSTVTGSDDYVLDPGALAAPEVAPPVVQRSNSAQPLFVVSRASGDVVTKNLQCAVTRADGRASRALPCAFGPNTVPLDNARFDGPVVLSVSGIDAAGNVSGASSATYSFDNLPPATPSLLAPDPNVSFERRAEFTFGDVDDADHYVCELRRAGQTGALPVTPCASPDKVTMPSFGAYAFSVWAVDAAGNRSAQPEAATYTYLAPVPEVKVLDGPTSGNDPTPTWTFSVPLGDSAECVLGLPGGQALSYTCTTPVTASRSVSLPLAQGLLRAELSPSATRLSSFTANLEGRPAGTYSLTTRITDAFGNVGDYGVKVLYRYNPAATGPDRITTTPQPGQPPTTTPRGGDTTPPSTTPTGSGSQGTSGGGQPTPRLPAAAGKGDAPTSAIPNVKFPSIPDVAQIPKAISRGISGLSQDPKIPILLAIVVVGFLLLQNQIDRRDPKLASAPVGAEPEMDFGPVLGRSGSGQALGGGAPA